MNRRTKLIGYIKMKNEMPTEQQMDVLKFLASDYELPVEDDENTLLDGCLRFNWEGDAKASGIHAIDLNFVNRIANMVADRAAKPLNLSGSLKIVTDGWSDTLIIQRIDIINGVVYHTKGRINWDDEGTQEILPFHANRYETEEEGA